MKLWFIVLPLCMAVLTACGDEPGEKAAEKAAEKMLEKQMGGDAQVDLDKGSLKVKTKDGEIAVNTGKDVKLPDGFPSDVYVYKDAKTIMTMSQPTGYMLTLQTEDKPEQVAEAYKQKLASLGWSVKTEMNMQGQYIRTFEKETRTVNIMVSTDDKESTIIQVSVSKE